MSSPPVLLSLVPAEYVHRDILSRRFTIVGIINTLLTPSLPCTPRHGIGVYLAVTDVKQAARVMIQLVEPDGQVHDVFSNDVPGTDPLTVWEAAGTAGVTFCQTGMHCIRATADGDMMGEWRFDVRLIGSNP